MSFLLNSDEEIGILIKEENFSLDVCFNTQTKIKKSEQGMNLLFCQYEIFIVKFKTEQEKFLRKQLFEKIICQCLGVSASFKIFEKLSFECCLGQLPIILQPPSKIIIFLIPRSDIFQIKDCIKSIFNDDQIIKQDNLNSSFQVESIMLLINESLTSNLYILFNKTECQKQNYLQHLQQFFPKIFLANNHDDDDNINNGNFHQCKNVHIIFPNSKCLVDLVFAKENEIFINFLNKNLKLQMHSMKDENGKRKSHDIDYILDFFSESRKIINPLLENEKEFVRYCSTLALKRDYFFIKSFIAQTNAILQHPTIKQERIIKHNKKTLHLLIYLKNDVVSEKQIFKNKSENFGNVEAYEKAISFTKQCKLECSNCKINSIDDSSDFDFSGIGELNFFKMFGEKIFLTEKKNNRIQLGLECPFNSFISISVMIQNCKHIFKSRLNNIRLCCLIQSLIKSTILHDYTVVWPLSNNNIYNKKCQSPLAINLVGVIWLNCFNEINLIIT